MFCPPGLKILTDLFEGSYKNCSGGHTNYQFAGTLHEIVNDRERTGDC